MSALTVLDSRYSWIRMGLTLAVAMVINAGMWLIISIMPAMQFELGVDRADALTTLYAYDDWLCAGQLFHRAGGG